MLFPDGFKSLLCLIRFTMEHLVCLGLLPNGVQDPQAILRNVVGPREVVAGTTSKS